MGARRIVTSPRDLISCAFLVQEHLSARKSYLLLAHSTRTSEEGVTPRDDSVAVVEFKKADSSTRGDVSLRIAHVPGCV